MKTLRYADAEMKSEMNNRNRILSLFAQRRTWHYDELAERLKMDLRSVVELCNELEQEGLIGEVKAA